VRLKLNLRQESADTKLFKQTQDVQFSFELLIGFHVQLLVSGWFTSAAATPTRVEHPETPISPK
jgi:hypothetical protein